MISVLLLALTQAQAPGQTRIDARLKALREQRELGRVGSSDAPPGGAISEAVGEARAAVASSGPSRDAIVERLELAMARPANDQDGLRKKVQALLACVNDLRGRDDGKDLAGFVAEAVLVSGQHRWIKVAALASLFGCHLYYTRDVVRSDERSTLRMSVEHEPSGQEEGGACCPVGEKIIDDLAAVRVLGWMLGREDGQLDLELFSMMSGGMLPSKPELLDPLHGWLVSKGHRPLRRYAALAISRYKSVRAHELLVSAAYDCALNDGARLVQTLRGIIDNGFVDSNLSNLLVILDGRLAGPDGVTLLEDDRTRVRGALEEIKSHLNALNK